MQLEGWTAEQLVRWFFSELVLVLAAFLIALIPVTITLPRQSAAEAQVAIQLLDSDRIIEAIGQPTVAELTSKPITLSLPTEDLVLGEPALRYLLDGTGNGQATISATKIKHLVWAIAQNHVDHPVKNSLVNTATGEVSQLGQPGRLLNQAGLANELLLVLIGQANNPIDLTQLVTIVEPERLSMTTPAPRLIEIDLSEQRLSLFDQGKEIAKHKVSTGKWSTPTPQGEFTIMNHVQYAYSRRYKLWMPRWLGLKDKTGRYLGYGIHELPEWGRKNKVKEAVAHLGRPASHGCIRLGEGAAEFVYQWAQNGTKVVIHS